MGTGAFRNYLWNNFIHIEGEIRYFENKTYTRTIATQTNSTSNEEEQPLQEDMQQPKNNNNNAANTKLATDDNTSVINITITNRGIKLQHW